MAISELNRYADECEASADALESVLQIAKDQDSRF
jgi:hypothetical protein